MLVETGASFELISTLIIGVFLDKYSIYKALILKIILMSQPRLLLSQPVGLQTRGWLRHKGFVIFLYFFAKQNTILLLRLITFVAE